MTPTALRAELARLGLSQAQAARLLGCTDRTLRRWVAGEIEVPRSVELLLARLTPDEAAALSKDPPNAETR